MTGTDEHAEVFADAGRWAALEHLILLRPGPPGELFRICFSAILHGDGTLPGDPDVLLPTDAAAFCALADGLYFGQTYAYLLFLRWTQSRGECRNVTTPARKDADMAGDDEPFTPLEMALMDRIMALAALDNWHWRNRVGRPAEADEERKLRQQVGRCEDDIRHLADTEPAADFGMATAEGNHYVAALVEWASDCCIKGDREPEQWVSEWIEAELARIHRLGHTEVHSAEVDTAIASALAEPWQAVYGHALTG